MPYADFNSKVHDSELSTEQDSGVPLHLSYMVESPVLSFAFFFFFGFYLVRNIKDCVCCIYLKQIVIINIYIAVSAL